MSKSHIVYFIQPKEFKGTNVYKIGMSERQHFNRVYKGYKSGTSWNCFYEVENSRNIERIIRAEFKEQFTLHQGREYFRGIPIQMFYAFNNIALPFAAIKLHNETKTPNVEEQETLVNIMTEEIDILDESKVEEQKSNDDKIKPSLQMDESKCQTPFYCKFCEKYFSTKGNLGRHFKICKKSLLNQKKVEKIPVNNVEETEIPVVNNIITKRIKTPGNNTTTKKHKIVSGNKVKKQQKTIDNEVKQNKVPFQTSFQRDGKTFFQCNLCNKEFTKFSNYKQHKNRKYPCVKEKNPIYNCEYCEKILSTKSNLQRHLKICKLKPQTPFNCESCKKYFSTKGNLERHLKICKIKKLLNPSVIEKIIEVETKKKENNHNVIPQNFDYKKFWSYHKKYQEMMNPLLTNEPVLNHHPIIAGLCEGPTGHHEKPITT